MKKYTYLIGSFALLTFILSLTGCKKDSSQPIPAIDVAGANLSGTWVVDGSQPNGVIFNSTEDRTELYQDFTLTINYEVGKDGGSYETSGSPDTDQWPTGGLWTFTSDQPEALAFEVERGDLLSLDVRLTETTMTLNFIYKSDNGGRQEAVDGQWEFNLIRQ